MRKFWDYLLNGEPAVFLGVVAIILDAVALALWGDEVALKVAMGLQAIAALVTRQQVYPQNSIEAVERPDPETGEVGLGLIVQILAIVILVLLVVFLVNRV